MTPFNRLPLECRYLIDDFINGCPLNMYDKVINQLHDLSQQLNRKKYIGSIIISIGAPNTIGNINWNNLWFMLIYKNYFVRKIAHHLRAQNLPLYSIHKIFINFECLSKI